MRILARWIRWRLVALACEVALDEPVDRAGDLREQLDNVVVPRRRQRMERDGAVRAGCEDTLGEQGVGVAVEVEQRAEPLHERNGAALRIADAMGVGAATLPGEHLAQEHAEEPREELAVAGDQEPDVPRQRQHPLPVRHGQRTRTKPWQSRPQARNFSNSRSTKRG